MFSLANGILNQNLERMENAGLLQRREHLLPCNFCLASTSMLICSHANRSVSA